MADNAIFVLGATGWIGSAIMRRIPCALPISTGRALNDGLAAAFAAAGGELSGPAVIVNAAGARLGDPADLAPLNAGLAAELAGFARTHHVSLVHLGSAAEYGLASDVNWVTEDMPAHPVSDYGKSKLAGSNAVLESGQGCVLRLFNIVDSPPQPGSPLADIHQRILRGVRLGEPVEVLSAEIARDYVSREFVAESVAAAAELRLTGLFNLSSGRAVTVRHIAEATVRKLGSEITVRDLVAVPANSIAADSSRWLAASGLSQSLDAAAIAEFLVADTEE